MEKKTAKKINTGQTLAEAGVLFLLMLGMLVYFLGLHRADFTVPMSYGAPNTGEMLTRAKLICTSGWDDAVSGLNAPFSATLMEQPGFLMQLLDAVFLKLLYLLTGNVSVALNLQIIFCFFAMAFTSFYAMKKLKFSGFSSILGSMTFSASTYIFMMTLTEYGMMNCYFVPLAVLVALWIFEDAEFFKFDKSFLHNKKNIAALVMVLLMCFNGAGYYSFFAGILILVAGFSALIKGKGKEKLLSAVILSGIIFIFGLLLSIPYFMGDSGYAAGSAVAAAEIYGIKLIQMFFPLNDLGIGIIGDAVNGYHKYTIVSNHLTISVFLGIVGIIGFVILMFVLLTTVIRKHKNERFGLLAEMVLVMLLVCQAGGIGALFTGILGDGLTDYSKGIIFIIYVSILAFFMGFECLLAKMKHKLPVMALCLLIVGGSILIQAPLQFAGFYGEPQSRYDAEKTFVSDMQENLGTGSYVYEPTVIGKYNPVGGNIREYNNRSIGFFLCDGLSWNIDVLWGYDADGWRNHLQRLTCAEMIQELKNAGYKAVFIDRTNYATEWFLENELTELENELMSITGNEFVVNDEKTLEYILIQ